MELNPTYPWSKHAIYQYCVPTAGSQPTWLSAEKTALNQSSIKNNNFEAGCSCLPNRVSSESFPPRWLPTRVSIAHQMEQDGRQMHLPCLSPAPCKSRLTSAGLQSFIPTENLAQYVKRYFGTSLVYLWPCSLLSTHELCSIRDHSLTSPAQCCGLSMCTGHIPSPPGSDAHLAASTNKQF